MFGTNNSIKICVSQSSIYYITTSFCVLLVVYNIVLLVVSVRGKQRCAVPPQLSLFLY